MGVDPNLLFLHYKALHCRKRRSAFSVRIVKYWNRLPASVVTAPSENIYKKRLEKSLDISLIRH